MATATQSALADALVADGPDPEHAEALMLFGQFVGESELDWTGYDEDGNETLTERGEWIFGWVLEGRAVQDVWIIPGRERRGRVGSRKGVRDDDPVLRPGARRLVRDLERACSTTRGAPSSRVGRATGSCSRAGPKKASISAGASPRSRRGRSAGAASPRSTARRGGCARRCTCGGRSRNERAPAAVVAGVNGPRAASLSELTKTALAEMGDFVVEASTAAAPRPVGRHSSRP